jgi:Chaperone of endosialidase
VHGEVSNAPANSFGVDGIGGIGVRGISAVAAISGLPVPTSGVGVQGVATSGTGTTYGGWFQSFSSSGVGVYGQSSSPNGFGVFSNGNLHVLGNITYSGTISQSSSRRWKTNIAPMTGALEKVERLQGVTYDWKESGRHDLGLIAEEVRLVVPEVVVMEENGVDAKGVDYGRLTSLLIEAVKEQQSQIRKEQDELQELKAEMQRLHSQLKLAAEQLRDGRSEGSKP